MSVPNILKADDVAEAIEVLVKIVGSAPGAIVFCTCIDADGYVGDSECFAGADTDKLDLPPDAVFHFARERSAAAVLITSKSSGPIAELHERDIEFTNKLRAEGSRVGIPLFEHVLVEGDTFRIMSESMGWGREDDS